LLRAPPKLGVRRKMSLSAGTNIHPPAHTVSTTYGEPTSSRQSLSAPQLVGARMEYEDGNIVRLNEVTAPKAIRYRDARG
jgi:hypothetical protein